MRGLKRNMRKMYYRLYVGKQPVYKTDLDGNIVYDLVTGDPLETGDYTITYGDPVEFKANLSSTKTSSSIEPFGVNTDYDKVILSCDMALPIDELSQLYVDRNPDDRKRPDYGVVRVARSINSTLYAIKQFPDGEV